MDGRLVVVIDKDPTLLELIKQRLAGDDLDILATRSCATAKLIVSDPNLRLVILDPAIEGGMELLTHIRAHARPVTVIVLTASAELRDELETAGVPIVFDRTVDTETLLSAVQQHLENSSVLPAARDVQILVVDDDEALRQMLTAALTQRGYLVITAGDGEKALKLIESNPDIAVVLLDLRLPSVGGMEVLTRIRGHKPDICVIMITGVIDREIARQAIRLGAFDYVIKPFDVVALHDLVVAGLSHRDYSKRSWWKRFMS